MVTQTPYGMTRQLSVSYDEAVVRVKAALKEEGFGVLTEIDVQDTIRQKLGKEFRKYDIIGACNPPLAHRALEAELQVGLLLPCNVIVYEDGDSITVAAFDPEAAMGLADNPALEEVAKEAKAGLKRALERL